MANLKISQLTGATTPLAGTEVLPIVQSGSTRQVSVANLTAGRTQTSNGVVQGTAGTGYNFTANTPAAGMTSQLLNWYEEGTWTPADGSGAGLTFTGATGHYTRIGRQVTAAFEVTYPTTANGNNARVTLPFAAGAGAGNTGFYVTLTNAGFEFTGITVSNNIQFYDNALVVKSNANFSGKLIRGVAVYFV